MVDEEEESGGKIDWTVAIVLSVAFHAAILGAVWMFSDRHGNGSGPGSDKPAEVAKTTAAEPADASATETSNTAETVVPVPGPAATPQPTSTATTTARPSDPATAEPAATPATGTYVVKSGDFLSRIANKCNCTVAELKKLNDIKDANSIRPGQKLKIPAQE